MGLLSEVKAEFGANGLYELFEVAKSSSNAQLKKAYKKAARKYHPDKAQQKDKDNATKRFQILSRAHAVLGNADARKVSGRAARGEKKEKRGGERRRGRKRGFLSVEGKERPKVQTGATSAEQCGHTGRHGGA